MSYVKESDGYVRHMDEVFANDRTDYDILYREYLHDLYIEHRRTFVSDEQPVTQNNQDNVDQRTK